jgi:glycosyltransferase involved in cell wall biosynthesis
MRVLMLTSEWPTTDYPMSAPFIVRQVHSLEKAGVQVDVFPFRGGKNPANYWRAWRRVRAKIQEDSYDLIHAQFGQSALLALPKRIPLVITLRGSDVTGFIGPGGRHTFSGWVLRQVSRFVVTQAEQVNVVAEHLTRYLPKRSYHLIPSGLDLTMFRPMPREEARRQLRLPTDTPLIFFPANPNNPIKRHGLAKAAVRVLSSQMDVEMITAGRIASEQIPLYMNACDVLLLTSQQEGSPNVVKEALACNLPVVSLDVGDVRLRLAPVEGCIVCENERPETIAAALKQVLAVRQRVNGQVAVQDLDENAQTQKLLSVYQLAVSRITARQ